MIGETRGFRHFDFTLGHAQTFDRCVMAAMLRDSVVVVVRAHGQYR